MDQPLFESEPPPAPRGERSFSVAELGELLSGTLNQLFPDDLWVEGQISNITRSRVGHVYFDLVEPAAPGEHSAAKVSVVLFSQTRQIVNAQLKRQNVGRLVDGMAVRVRAAVDFYPPQGRLQLRMTGIDPRYILATMAAERDALLARLHAAGITERNKAQPMPLVPQRIGLVTSRGSAADEDFQTELARFGCSFTLLCCDARVQGELAAPALTAAVRQLSTEQLDVIVLIRGGGSRGDLAVFDNEALAMAISEAPVPVLTGIGHEIDRSVADVVAHAAFKTPTAVAAELGGRTRAFCDRAETTWSHITTRATESLDDAAASLRLRAGRAARAGRESVDRADDRLARQLADLPKSAERLLRTHDTALDHLAARLRAADPQLLLRRGWSITRTAEGEVVRSIEEVASGDTLISTVADGTIISNVSLTDPTPEPADV